MIKQHEIISLRKGAGALRHYKYYANGIRLHSKKDILQAIELKLNRIIRIDKFNNHITFFNYKTMDFGDV